MTLLLGRGDISRLLDMPDVIEAVRQAHMEHARGHAMQDLCPTFSVEGSKAALLPMIAASDSGGMAVAKLLVDNPGNGKNGLPVQQSTIMVIDMITGKCDAILHGGTLTAFRTAAASAVASSVLSRPDSHALGLIGAGNLARTHLEAISLVRDIREVFVWSRTADTSARFAADARAQGFSVAVCDSPRDVVRRSDILCTLTPSLEPVVQGEWFSEGLHVNAVGAPPRSDHREIDSAGMKRARIVVDDLASVLAHSGEILIPLAQREISEADISAELGEILIGEKPGRERADEITVFDSVGVPIQDIATVRLILEKARNTGCGVEIDLNKA
ncbi:ornithine cyclodeaminase family protein [uncultured Castellaniella sp.]|uniref:ornithine cyclodeaminase family protein n=1 Tax=uncultured Castellaniella sp. TaxID=647907 RepID=UPI002629CCA0|nr:ornithine cyclodeaminase family protein [uncultured Castellaniella sp.]